MAGWKRYLALPESNLWRPTLGAIHDPAHEVGQNLGHVHVGSSHEETDGTPDPDPGRPPDGRDHDHVPCLWPCHDRGPYPDLGHENYAVGVPIASGLCRCLRLSADSVPDPCGRVHSGRGLWVDPVFYPNEHSDQDAETKHGS